MPNKAQERFLMREYKSNRKRVTGLAASFRFNPHDPPDFWLTSGGLRYAVEITNVVHEENRCISSAQWNLVREVEHEALRKGILSGRYIVAFRDPWRGAKQKSGFKQRILEFIAESINEKRTLKKEIVIDGRSLCDIQKYAAAGAKIHPVGGGINELGGCDDDVRNQLSLLIDRAIKVKAKKMAAHRPAILVLYDLFGLADRSAFIACVRAVPEARFFKEIYIAEDKGRGFPVPIPKRSG